MIEAFSHPILLKATNFLFEEVSKILQERRERRQAEQKGTEAKIDDPTLSEKSENDTNSKDVISSVDVALNQKVEESIWLHSEAEVEHLLSLLEIHTRNYYLAKEQYAKWGSALVPSIIANNLTEAEDEVVKTTKKLQATLSKVYGKEVIVSDVGQT